MNFIETEIEDFTIVGISVRTTNQEGKAIKDIQNLFGLFFSENISLKIKDKTSDDIYCIYTDYASDYMGDYTVFLGYRITTSTLDNSNLEVKQIPASKYRKYTSQGEIHTAVGKTWNDIWNDNSIARKYSADFDVYGSESKDPQNGIVYTYLSVVD